MTERALAAEVVVELLRQTPLTGGIGCSILSTVGVGLTWEGNASASGAVVKLDEVGPVQAVVGDAAALAEPSKHD